MYAATMYAMYEKSFDFLPGATFEEVHLSIEVDVGGGSWYIDRVDVCEESPGTKYKSFSAGEWIFKNVAKAIYDNAALCDDISLQSREAAMAEEML
ncbi:hypothetical protein UFOVP661_34 [uncultured Caudovirales phage]|uniref:Uncharacterized protein n=1 Tax=uncultured Caudovirales phage TaxID=2100421 RepID=A0A6J5N900_9CAUD|nr:hypothetical protein UFOVP661_34 [uncultured Caudovirales phage]